MRPRSLASRIATEINQEICSEVEIILHCRLDSLLPLELDELEIQAAVNKFTKSHKPRIEGEEDFTVPDSFYSGVKWALRALNKDMGRKLR